MFQRALSPSCTISPEPGIEALSRLFPPCPRVCWVWLGLGAAEIAVPGDAAAQPKLGSCLCTTPSIFATGGKSQVLVRLPALLILNGLVFILLFIFFLT